MSLLKRIESARRGAGPGPPPAPASRGAGAPAGPPAGAQNSARLMTQGPVRESFRDVKFRIQSRVIQDLDPKLDLSNQVEVRRQIEEIFGKVIDEEGLALTRAERVRMLEQITDEIIGLGPLEPLLRDESISEVMVNGPRQVYIERSGKLELTNVVFQNDDHVMRIIDRIIAPIGRRIDESSPMVDARLADGSRVNSIIPPLSLVGPIITIRKFAATPFTVEDLIRFGTATPEMFEFLEACVKARLNIFVSGGTGRSMPPGTATARRDMLARREPRGLRAGRALPLRAIREQIASAVDLIVHQNRLKDGSRKIVNITEVQGMEGDVIVMQDIFVFEQTAVVEGKIQGRLRPTGIRPKFVEKVDASGIHLPPNVFGSPF